MDGFITKYCVSLLLLTSIATSANSNDTNQDEPRRPRVSGRIVKLYSGPKPEPYLCTGEGFQGDPINCAVFYRCIKEKNGKFTVFRYQCAPGTVYDTDLETCNHPRSTRRSECGGMQKATVKPPPATYIDVFNSAQSEIPKPISTNVPIYTEQTTFKNPATLDWILSNEHQSTQHTQMPLSSTTYKSLSSIGVGQDKSTKNPQTEYITTAVPPLSLQQSDSKMHNTCTSDGFMGDSENCRKFYRCVGNQRGGYVKYEFSCSELTVWDDDIQGCNHPWAVKRSKCGRSMAYNEKSQQVETDTEEKTTVKELLKNNGGYGHKSRKTIQHQLQISKGPQVTQTQTQISNSNDIIQNQTQIHYDTIDSNTYPGSKQNQTQISYGTAVSQIQTQIDYANKGVQTQLQIDHSKNSSQSQTQIQESTTVQSFSTVESHGNGNNECLDNGFMGDANDCKKFYRCVDNGRGTFTKYQYVCGEGTVWDPQIEACNHAWAVKNCGGKLPIDNPNEGYTTSSTSTMKTTEHFTEVVKTTQNSHITSQSSDIDDEDDIGYGNQNDHGITSSTSTIKPITTTTISTTTDKSNKTTTECTSSGFIGNPNDCKIFYRCVDDGNGGYTKFEFKCGDGTLWDPNIEACNHAWAVKKCGGSGSQNDDNKETPTQIDNTTPAQHIQTTITLIQITTETPSQSNDYDNGYGIQNHESSSSTIRTTKPQSQDSENGSKCKSNGFMGDQKDCKIFYRCVDNGNGGFNQYEFKCGEGTVWDSEIEACNHAWAVKKCGGANNEIAETTSPTFSTVQTSTIYTTPSNNDTERPVHTTTTTTKMPITVSDLSNKCTNSGFMGDNENCKKFYRCVDNGDGSFIRYEFTCGEGTVWDPEIEACNHAWAVKKCGANSNLTDVSQQTTTQHPIIHDEEQDNGYASPSYDTAQYPQTSTTTVSSNEITSNESGHCSNSGFVGDKIDCKKFYRCVDNGKGGYDRYEFQCGEGTVWDSSIEACNHAWAVKECGLSGSSSTHVENESTTQDLSSPASDYGQAQQSTEKITTTSQSYHEPGALSDECFQEGFFGNQYNCKQFYRCVDNGKGNFTKYEFTCGEGTSWNPDIHGCDHIQPNRPCSVTANQETTHSNDVMDFQTSTTAKSTTINEGTETTKKPEFTKGKCNAEGFYGNPSDCRMFYRCVADGKGTYTKYDFTCGQGTVWNQEIQACDHETDDKTCKSSSSNNSDTNETQSESTTNSYVTTNKPEPTDKTESTESSGSHCTSEGFYAHPNNCKKFVRCVGNGKGGYTRYEFSCGDGTVWVQEIQACDHDNDVTSCSAQNETSPTEQSQNTEKYSSSMSDSNIMSSTENMTPIREDDEYETDTSKAPSSDEHDQCTSEGYFANQEDCRKFYRCVDNGNGGYTKYDFACGEGTAWDQNLQTCNHINEVQSCNGNNQENENHHTTNINQTEAKGTSTTTKTTLSSTSSAGSSSSDSQDTCQSEGYFGDSKDCKKFYRCVDNEKGGYTKYEFDCGDGTIWDQDITNCNHPQDVSNPSCSSTQGSDNTSSTSSATTSSSQTTSSITESSSTSSNSNSSTQDTLDCSQESSKKPVNNNVTCDKAGYYANPNDCKKFYRCVDWDGDGKRFSVFHFECGDGTIWDPALDTCNHEDSVYPQRDCSQTQSQSVEGESTTTEGTTSTTTEATTSEPTTQQSTSEQTTTQKTTTSEMTTTAQQQTTQQTEQTTAQESTTSEQSTTQQPTTASQTTTQESTTSEQTTTQKSTTTEQTTTQQQTTSQQIDQTTTQESTTSEQTTTQQPATSEKTTTQESTTTEQTTTQQAATSEQTTTQESTTSEQTTSQQPATSEQSTTQESTTSEQTTTQQSTTTDQTTTQESSTSEQTTTQQPTTAEDTTTEQSTTSEQTTTEQSNEQTTEQTSTTTEQTTEGTSSTENNKDQSTTETSSTESNTTEATESSLTTEEPSLSDKECPETDDNQYLLVCPTSFKRHPKYCNMFYQCTEDEETYEPKVATFKCPNNTIYDEDQTQCVTEDKANEKCEGELANKRRYKRLGSNYKDPIVADKEKLSCTTEGYFSFEKKIECAKGFLKCEKNIYGLIKGHVYQCPDGYIYWSISKRCERIDSVRDCKRSSNDWTGRWNIPVERKNVAVS